MKITRWLILGPLLAVLIWGALKDAAAASPELRTLQLMGKLSLEVPRDWTAFAGQTALPSGQNNLEDKPNWAIFAPNGKAGLVFHYYARIMQDWPDEILRGWDFTAQNAVLDLLKEVLSKGMILLDSQVKEINQVKYFVLDVRVDVEHDTPPTYAQLYHVFNGPDLAVFYFMCPETVKEDWLPVFRSVMQSASFPPLTGEDNN